MDDLFKLSNDELKHMSPQEAVIFMRDLLWCEALKKGIPINKINISINVHNPDGGIDASVNDVSLGDSEIIKDGVTGYQIKTGEGFKPWQESSIKNELFNGKDPKKENLGASIKECLDKNGHYILSCFGHDLNQAQHSASVKILQDYFNICSYKNVKVEVWSQNNLISFTLNHPSLIFRLKKIAGLPFQTHNSWASDAEMRRLFVPGKEQLEFIETLQNFLLTAQDALHIRVWGEPGIGKTRLVLESTKIEQLKSAVIYFPSSSFFIDSPLMSLLQMEDNNFETIFVIDECNTEDRTYIWNKLKNRGTRIKLITIYNELDSSTGETNYLDAPILNRKEIVQIITSYGIPSDVSDRWAELCGGSPRVAHLLGQNISSNEQDYFKEPDTTIVWDRCICGIDNKNSEKVNQRRIVLEHIALFKKFGMGKDAIKEAKAISEIVQKVDHNITWHRFQEIIFELKRRRLLQGEITLYITPKALQIKLWIDWWEKYGENFDLDEFSSSIPKSLLEWFFEMIKYAGESKVASYHVKKLLGENGPFQKNDLLKTRLGGSFFLALTEADPKSALKCLQRTIGTWNKFDLLNLIVPRREIVWALERIVIWGDLFQEGAQILLKLAEAENEKYSNNATGVFIDLFTPAPGKLAPTEASLKERLPILMVALDSSDHEIRKIALSACDVALKTRSFSRNVGAEFQGLKREPNLWRPSSNEEVYEYFTTVWQKLENRIDNVDEEEQKKIIEILFRNARGLAIISQLSEMILESLRKLSNKKFINKKNLLTEINRIIHFEGKNFSKEIRKEWEELKKSITGDGYSARLRRYVGMNLLEDSFDEEGNRTDVLEENIINLAKESLNNIEQFGNELDWIVTSEAENGYSFGYQLSKIDSEQICLDSIVKSLINAKDKGNGFFIGGYFRGIFEKDSALWTRHIKKLSQMSELSHLLIEIIRRSGLTDEIANLLLNLVKQKKVDLSELKFFAFGGLISNLSQNVFMEWLEYILDQKDSVVGPMALALMNHYYIIRDMMQNIPESISFRTLTHNSLLTLYPSDYPDPMNEYYWTQLGKLFVKKFETKNLELAKIILQYSGVKRSIFQNSFSETEEVLNFIVKKFPDEIWDLVKLYMGPPIDDRAFNIYNWLKGGRFHKDMEGALQSIPKEKILKWVDENPDERAWYYATFVPQKFFIDKDKVCHAREVLINYGGRKEVREELTANFLTEGWTGPTSTHYMRKKRGLLRSLASETNNNVKLWLDEFIEILDQRIEIAKFEEERGRY